jgi:hypothetical protein
MSDTPIDIRIDRDAIARIKRDFLLMGSEVPVALSRAINRTVTTVQTEASKQVRKEYNLKAARVKKNFSLGKSTKNNLSAHWRSKGEPVGLLNFGARQNKKGTSVKVLKSSSRKTVRHAFIQVGRNKQKHVFRRELDSSGKMVPRYDIHRLTGPRVEDALSKDHVQKALQDKADTYLQTRLDAEANYILSKARS